MSKSLWSKMSEEFVWYRRKSIQLSAAKTVEYCVSQSNSLNVLNSCNVFFQGLNLNLQTCFFRIENSKLTLTFVRKQSRNEQGWGSKSCDKNPCWFEFNSQTQKTNFPQDLTWWWILNLTHGFELGSRLFIVRSTSYIRDCAGPMSVRCPVCEI